MSLSSEGYVVQSLGAYEGKFPSPKEAKPEYHAVCFRFQSHCNLRLSVDGDKFSLADISVLLRRKIGTRHVLRKRGKASVTV
jgi:hypothetical protein